MLKRNKIFIFLIIILCVFSMLTPKAFASIDYLGKEFPDFPEGFGDAKYKIIAYYPQRGSYVLLFWNGDGSYFDTSYFIDEFGFESSVVHCQGLTYIYDWNPTVDSSWILRKSDNYGSVFYGWQGYDEDVFSSDSNALKTMIYSNFDITIDDTDNCFFYKTPLLRTTTTQSVIGGNIYQEIKKLLITILVVLVSLVGLRKGLKMLSTVLHQS